MKTEELRSFSDEELNQKLSELKTELFNLRFQMAAGQLEHTHRLRFVRKDIARVLTAKTEREFSINEGKAPKIEGPKAPEKNKSSEPKEKEKNKPKVEAKLAIKKSKPAEVKKKKD